MIKINFLFLSIINNKNKMRNRKILIITVLFIFLVYIIYQIIQTIKHKNQINKKNEYYVTNDIISKNPKKLPPPPNSPPKNPKLPVTWVDKWSSVPDVKNKLPGFLVTKGNNLYLATNVIKEDTQKNIPNLPLKSEIDSNTLFIYTNEFVLPSSPTFPRKMQLITYGMKDTCNSTDSRLCTGMVSFVNTNLDDSINTQFSKSITDNGKTYLIHKPTNLMITYVYISQDMIDAANMYPTGQIAGQKFARFYMSETPDLIFNVLGNNKVGDIAMFVYIGNGLSNQFPHITTVRLKDVKPRLLADTKGFINMNFEISLQNEIDIDTKNGKILIKKEEKGLKGDKVLVNKRLSYIALNDKVGRISTKPDENNDKSSDWQIVMPGLSKDCKKSEVFVNGKCKSCGDGYYYSLGICQKCLGQVSDDKLSCFLGLELLGQVYEEHEGYVKMSDEKWLTIADLLIFIAGPKDDSDECFRYGGCSWSAPWNCIVDAGNWIKDRTMDAVNFVKNAVDKVGSWAKQATSDALKWAESAGKTILSRLIKMGNAISCYARKAMRAISDTVIMIANLISDFGDMAKRAIMKVLDWIKNAGETVWNKLKEPVGMLINIVLEGTVCEYSSERKISKLSAVKALEPALVPRLRLTMMELVKSFINIATNYVLTPILILIMPFIENELSPYIDGLIQKALRTNELQITITTIADPIVGELSKISCIYLNGPSIDDIQITVPDNIEFDDITIDDMEPFRYNKNDIFIKEYYRSISTPGGLSSAEKVAILVEKIQLGIKLYNQVQTELPKIKENLSLLTDWNKLKTKICLWAKENKLLTGLISVLQKAYNDTRIKESSKKIIKKMIYLLTKLLVVVSIANTLKGLLSLAPALPSNIRSAVDKFSNVDSALLDIITKLPGLNNMCVNI